MPSEITWGSASEIVAAIAGIATAGAAIWAILVAKAGFEEYKRQVRYEHTHGLAIRLLTATYRFRTAIRHYRLRPMSEREIERGVEREAVRKNLQRYQVTRSEAAFAVMETRFEVLSESAHSLELALAEAEAAWGRAWAIEYRRGFWEVRRELDFQLDMARQWAVTPNAPENAGEAYIVSNVLDGSMLGNSDRIDKMLTDAVTDAEMLVNAERDGRDRKVKCKS